MNNDHYPIQQLFPQADNLTRFAVANGYVGNRPVLVLDGRVISHRSVNWFDFCMAIRRFARRRTPGSTTHKPRPYSQLSEGRSLGNNAKCFVQSSEDAGTAPVNAQLKRASLLADESN